MPTVKPTTTQRGYGHDHQQEKDRWRPVVEAGNATCARCGEPIVPGTPWDMGHTDDRTAYSGPEHARCNRAAGGRAALQKRQLTRRDW